VSQLLVPDRIADTDRLIPTDAAEVRGPGADRYLTFSLAGAVYALGIPDITEIMEYRNLTTVPMMPSFIRGVINLRGRVVPVIDLGLRFGLGGTEIARRTSIIIVEAEGGRPGRPGRPGQPGQDGAGTPQNIGLMVDAVNKVEQIGSTDIEPPPTFGAGISSDFIAGMARHNDAFIIVLDAGRLLSLDESALIQQAALSAQGDAVGE
jgi:purine-binding chemotaxis protein CheW